MELYGIIYKITCSVTNKCYIGQTIKSLEKRWNDHQRDFKRFLKHKNLQVSENKIKSRNFCTYLYNAINSYGIDKFQIEQISIAFSKEDLNKQETENILKFNTLSPYGYNLTSGGEGGWKFSPEILEKISVNTKKGIEKNIDNLRKNDKSKGLPVHCLFTKLKSSEEAFLIQKHPRCNQKIFKIKDYETYDLAEKAMREFLDNLEKKNEIYIIPKIGGNNIPKGIMKIKNGFRVKKCINGKMFVKDFKNIENAKEFLENVINNNSKIKKSK